jgi:5-methylcytosine-specific restriction endonuclease McrA
VEVLNIPEPSAYNRLKAARAAGRFPVILEMLAAGELHLTGIALLEPHLTEDNHQELLAACRRRSKRKIQELLADRFPQADRRPVLRPLPTPAPRAAAETESRAPAAPPAPADRQQPEAPAAAAARGGEATLPGLFAATAPGEPGAAPASAPPSPVPGNSAAAAPGPAPRLEPTGPERYRLSVTLSRCTHDKLRRAQALLRHRLPAGDLEAVLDSALDALLGQLEKRKAARVERPRPAPTTAPVPGRPASRHIPAHVRREVWERDGGQCSFVSAAGRRCGETGFLEYDHITPFAQGGAATVDNIRLLCRAHNQARVAPEVARRAAREVCREHQRQAPGTVAGSRRSAGEAGSAPRAPAQAHASRPRAGAAESHGGCMNATHRGPRGKSQQACDDGSGPRPVKRTAVEPVPVEEMPRHSECAVTCAAEHASDAG